MGASPEISVIVVAYNAEGCIARCLDSILAQSFRDFELLVLNDGSSDGTQSIIDSYKASDPRIRSVCQENRGVAMTRQEGLELARGRYSIFVDSDDWIEPDMLEGLHSKAFEADADMVLCDILEEFEDHAEYRRQNPGTGDHLAVQRKMLNELQASMWNKLIRHEVYREYGVRFIEGVNCCEDQLLLIRLLSNPLKVAYVGKAYYHYDKAINAGSITNRWHSRPIKERLLFLETAEPYMQQGQEHREAFDYYVSRRIYDSTYAGKDEDADYRLIYSRYRSSLKRSSLPMKQKMLCHLRYAGLGWLIRLIRHSRA